MMTWIGVWLAMFGIWPLAHPDHDGTTLMSGVDLVLHFVGLVIFLRAVREWARRDGAS